MICLGLTWHPDLQSKNVGHRFGGNRQAPEGGRAQVRDVQEVADEPWKDKPDAGNQDHELVQHGKR